MLDILTPSEAATGASFAQALGISQGFEAGVFYVAWPISITIINLFPVNVSKNLANTSIVNMPSTLAGLNPLAARLRL